LSLPLAPAETAPASEAIRVWVDERVERGQVLAGRFETRQLE
jgi:hypothetical protein